LLFLNDDPGIQRFVIEHLFVVGGACVTVFGTGFAVGRLWFDRANLFLRAAAEDFKRERDATREQRDELKQLLAKAKAAEFATRPDAPGDGSRKYTDARRQEARAHIAGRFLSAIVAMMLLGAAVYNVYELRSLSLNSATEKTLTEFRDKSHGSFRELNEKLKEPAKPGVSSASKSKRRASDGSRTGSQN